jgi:hypothetical protein
VTTIASDPNKTDAFRQSLGSTLNEFVIDCSFSQVTCDMSSFRVWKLLVL